VGQCFYGYKKAHRIMGFDVVAGGDAVRLHRTYQVASYPLMEHRVIAISLVRKGFQPCLTTFILLHVASCNIITIGGCVGGCIFLSAFGGGN
jgi:hypothetical protein